MKLASPLSVDAGGASQTSSPCNISDEGNTRTSLNSYRRSNFPRPAGTEWKRDSSADSRVGQFFLSMPINKLIDELVRIRTGVAARVALSSAAG